MRSRTIREGSVGLLILLGLGLFTGITLWIRGLTLGQRSYTAMVFFTNVGGMQEGAEVRYRGFKVGNISEIRPAANGVEVYVRISPSDLIIPRDVIIEANQSGFISEVSIEMRPQKELPSDIAIAKPLDQNCDRTLIICDGSRLSGQLGVSFDELIRFSTRFTAVYSDPRLYDNINAAAKNASIAAAGLATLSRDISRLSRSTQQQLNNFSAAANSVGRAADQISSSTNKTVAEFGATANQIRLTTTQVERLVTNVDSLVSANRTSLVTALTNITQTSEQLRGTVNSLAPTLNRVNQGELLQNLETLSANAAQAAANLRDLTNALNTPTNVLVLQQTLDSARATFQNAQKITADLDELTGDPAFRDNLRELVNGLSGLVSSTQEIQQQVEVAQTLDSVKAAMNAPPDESGNLGLVKNRAVAKIPIWNSTAFLPLAETWRLSPSAVKTEPSQDDMGKQN